MMKTPRRVGLFVGVGERDNDLRGAEEGVAWPSSAGGRGRRVKPNGSPMRYRAERAKCKIENRRNAVSRTRKMGPKSDRAKSNKQQS